MIIIITSSGHRPTDPSPLSRRIVAAQGLLSDLVQVTDAVLVHHGHLEGGQIHDQTLLDLHHALLEDVVRLLLGQFWKDLRVHE